MARGKGEGSNKAARMAQKEQNVLDKMRAEDQEREKEEASRWETGSKKSGKKDEQAAKRAEQLRKKADRDALLEEEEDSTPGRREPKKTKRAEKKSKGLDLSQLDDNDDDDGDRKLRTLNATGIENALDALGVDDDPARGNKIEKHPERRYPAALARYEEQRLEEMKEDGTGEGLRMNQRKALIKKEFEKHPDNPFNQLTATYNATKDEIGRIRAEESSKIESRLAEEE